MSSSSKDDNAADDLAAELESKVKVQEEDDKAADELAAELESKLKVQEEKGVKDQDKIHVKEAEDEKDPNLQTIADWLRNAKRILVLSGAGVSVSAGIPDFRTKGTGLYDNLTKYNLPYAEAVFDIDYYTKVTPLPFVQLASELWPSSFGPRPTLTHSFVALLHRKRQLLRNYSQNIDGLEHMANIPEDKLVECHGHFRSASCTSCQAVADIHIVRQRIVQEKRVPTCEKCNKYVKPDIVFFGEQLPERFHRTLPGDLQQADLCLILGTSLQVPPVAFIPDRVRCKRVLLNRELVGTIDPDSGGDNGRDAFYAGDCDDTVLRLARQLGWEEELLELNRQKSNNNNKEEGRGGGAQSSSNETKKTTTKQSRDTNEQKR